MTSLGLLRRTYYLNEQETKYFAIYLNENTKLEVKIVTLSGHAVWNEIYIKTDIPKNEVHEVGDPQHSLSVFCGRYIRITSENT